MLLDGLLIPLTTPFYPDGRLYLRKLEHNVRRYTLTPAAGLVVLGELGEAGALSDEETVEVLRTAAAACGPEKVLLAGVGRDSVTGTLRMAQTAADAGYDVALAQAGLELLGARQDARWTAEVLTFFRMVADRSPLPVLVGGRKGMPLPMGVLAELVGHPRVIGCLEVDGDAERIRAAYQAAAGIKREVAVTMVFRAVTGRMLRAGDAAAKGGSYIAADLLSGAGSAVATAPPTPAIKTRSKMVGFQVVGGRSLEIVGSFDAGATAVVPGMGACAPQSTYEVVAAWKDGDAELAREKQLRLTPAAEGIEEALGVAGVKFGCDVHGYFGGPPRLPRLGVSGAERRGIEVILKPLRG